MLTLAGKRKSVGPFAGFSTHGETPQMHSVGRMHSRTGPLAVLPLIVLATFLPDNCRCFLPDSC
jgi:hypothetical protein